MNIVKLMLIYADGINSGSIATGMEYACINGHSDIVKYLYKVYHIRNEDYISHNNLMQDSCKNGNMELVEFIINEGNKRDVSFDWSWGLYYAFIDGDKEIIQLMLDNGAKLKYGFWGACAAQNIRVVCQVYDALVEKKLEDDMLLDGKEVLYHVCKGGDDDIIQFVLKKGLFIEPDFSTGLHASIRYGNTKAIRLMVNSGANTVKTCQLKSICRYGRVDTVLLLADMITSNKVTLVDT